MLSCNMKTFDIFIKNTCSYHVAEKKIPSINGFIEGVKLEQFIFDSFPYAPSTALFEVLCSVILDESHQKTHVYFRL